MTQTLASTIGLATARSKANEVVDKTTTKEDPATEEKSFHAREMDRLEQDPENAAYSKAVAAGKLVAKQFLDAVTNIHHPLHEKSFAQYADQYHLNAKEAEDDIIDQTATKHGASPYEKFDPSYEETLLKKFKPTGEAVDSLGNKTGTATTEMSMKFYNAFVDSMREKWFRVGYKGDKSHVEAFGQKYGLTPNMQIATLKDFQPKK